MVVICWMYVPSSCKMHTLMHLVTKSRLSIYCKQKNSKNCVKLQIGRGRTWSDRVCSWATMMCSCPKACSRSGVMTVWWACRAVVDIDTHTHTGLVLCLPLYRSDGNPYTTCIGVPSFIYIYSSLHCSVAKASSSLLTMMVCWDESLRVLRVAWSWLWRRSMWNFRWPLRLNLRYWRKNRFRLTWTAFPDHFVV